MKRIKEILSRIGEGTTIGALAEELNMNKSLLRAIIEFSIDKGYLKEIDTQHDCAKCLLILKCSTKDHSFPIKMYILTAKGLELISSSSIG
ncbi:MAG: hypothetical protein DRP74_07865 [Candidatus Omnitrophota bacterium]|nr:MAG: hypothetical protein DRP74_07865 [Candidatus Omnitrophota bacterium]